MTPEERDRLLASYATGGLSDAERRRLFESALHDQELFEALYEEEPLRELLADAEVRGEVLEMLDEQPAAEDRPQVSPAPMMYRMSAVPPPAQTTAMLPTLAKRAGWWRRNRTWVMAAAPVLGLLLVTISITQFRSEPTKPAVEIAQSKARPASEPVTPPLPEAKPRAAAPGRSTPAPRPTGEAMKHVDSNRPPLEKEAEKKAPPKPPAAADAVAVQATNQTISVEATPPAPAPQQFQQARATLPAAPQVKQQESPNQLAAEKSELAPQAFRDGLGRTGQTTGAVGGSLGLRAKLAPGSTAKRVLPTVFQLYSVSPGNVTNPIADGAIVEQGTDLRLVINLPDEGPYKLVRLDEMSRPTSPEWPLQVKSGSPASVDLGKLPAGDYRYRLDPIGAVKSIRVR